MTLRRSRNVPPTPPSFVRFAAKVSSVISGSRHLDSDERPRAGADVRRAGGAERDRRDCGCRVVRADGDDGRSADARLGGDACEERAERRPRLDELGQEPRGMPRRSSRSSAQAPLRASRHCVEVAFVHSPTRARRASRCSRSGIISSVSAPCEHRIVLGGHCGELVERVDREDLDPGALVQLARRHPLEHRPERSGAPVVAVVDRVADEPAAPVEEPEVDGPRVDADRVDPSAATPAARSPSSASRYRPRMSQCSVSPSRTGSFANRCTSVTSRRSPSKRPTATRPLWAPRSTAAIVAIRRRPRSRIPRRRSRGRIGGSARAGSLPRPRSPRCRARATPRPRRPARSRR